MLTSKCFCFWKQTTKTSRCLGYHIEFGFQLSE